MLNLLLFVFGMQYFTDAIFDKWFVWDYIEEKGTNANWEWLYNLSFCRFCLLFWVSVVWTLFGCLLFGYNLNVIAVPFVVKGITYIIEK